MVVGFEVWLGYAGLDHKQVLYIHAQNKRMISETSTNLEIVIASQLKLLLWFT